MSHSCLASRLPLNFQKWGLKVSWETISQKLTNVVATQRGINEAILIKMASFGTELSWILTPSIWRFRSENPLKNWHKRWKIRESLFIIFVHFSSEKNREKLRKGKKKIASINKFSRFFDGFFLSKSTSKTCIINGSKLQLKSQ